MNGNLDNSWSRIAKSVARLGSGNDAEKLAALNGVERLLAAQGRTYIDLSVRVEGSLKQQAFYRAPRPQFFDMARACRDIDCGRLSPAEKQFVGDMCRLGNRSPSPRQAAWLASIFGRLHEQVAA